MNSATISRNTFWYGLDMGYSFIAGLFTSVAVARVLGPEKLGVLVFIIMLASLASSLGSLGIPGTAGKYMAEYLGKGETAIARSIFFTTLKLQTILSLIIVTVSIGLYFAFGDRRYFLVAVMQIASIVPLMIGLIAAQANVASENLMANVPGALVSTTTYTIVVLLTLHFGWGLTGLATSMLASRSAELVVRLIPTIRRIQMWPKMPLPDGLQKRMFAFSRNGLILMVLSIVVWDRSEIFFLKHFWTDVTQIAFYSVAFNITEKILIGSQVFGAATASSLMAQFGRSANSLGPMVATAVRYHALMAVPIHVGVAVLAGPILLVLYGHRYAAAIPLLSIAALLGVSKALMPPLNNGLSAKDRQGLVVRWMLTTALFNLLLDTALIPHYGALGAIIANGVAQTFAMVGLMAIARGALNFGIPFAQLARIGVSGLVTGAALLMVRTRVTSNVSALLVIPPCGAIIFFTLLRITSSLDQTDRIRVERLVHKFPRAIRKVADVGVSFLVPAVSKEAL